MSLCLFSFFLALSFLCYLRESDESRPGAVFQLQSAEAERSHDGAGLARRGRDAVERRPEFRRKHLGRDDERRGVGTEIREEEREGVEHEEDDGLRERGRLRERERENSLKRVSFFFIVRGRKTTVAQREEQNQRNSPWQSPSSGRRAGGRRWRG